MARVQLALNVSDLNEAIAFYTKLFGSAPAKVQPGYANFAIADPPLKLVLMEEPGDPRRRRQSARSTTSGSKWRRPTKWPTPPDRLRAEGLETEEQRATTCCYAVQDKVWVEDPDHTPWEIYTVLADAPTGSARRQRRDAVAPRGTRRGVSRLLLLTLGDEGRTHARCRALAPAERRVPGQRVPGRRSSSARESLRSSSPPGTPGCSSSRTRPPPRAGLFAIILMFGAVSGGHFNPIVSFVDAAFGGLRWR